MKNKNSKIWVIKIKLKDLLKMKNKKKKKNLREEPINYANKCKIYYKQINLWKLY